MASGGRGGDGAVGGSGEAGQEPKQCGFAHPVGTDDPEDGSGCDGAVDVGEHRGAVDLVRHTARLEDDRRMERGG